MSDIVKRLRAQVHDIWEAEDLRLEAADRIAALEAEVARLRDILHEAYCSLPRTPPALPPDSADVERTMQMIESELSVE
jgi:hypothetical protein